MSPFSGLKTKPSKKLAEACGKLSCPYYTVLQPRRLNSSHFVVLSEFILIFFLSFLHMIVCEICNSIVISSFLLWLKSPSHEVHFIYVRLLIYKDLKDLCTTKLIPILMSSLINSVKPWPSSLMLNKWVNPICHQICHVLQKQCLYIHSSTYLWKLWRTFVWTLSMYASC
jgi:hypothetical protein